MDRSDDYMTAEEAAEFLGVTRSTLYAYVSRGQLESVAGEEDGRQRRYRRSQLERLKRKKEASKGHEAAATDAMNWGAPSLTTEIGEITPRGPRYRGYRLRELVEQRWSFEAVAELLWTGESGEVGAWPSERPEAGTVEPDDGLASAHPLEVMASAIQAARLADPARYARGAEQRLGTARALVCRTVRHCGSVFAARAGWLAPQEEPASAETSVAGLVCRAVGAPTDEETRRLVETTLIACADHGLNASAFAGRVAASTGADLYACLLAAVSAFSGPHHGLMSERVGQLCRSAGSPEAVESTLRRRLRAGEELPGFGHPLYEHGDPRCRLLRRRIAEQGRSSVRLETLDAMCEAAERAGMASPNLDVGLAAVTAALDLPDEAGPFLFASGRMAGWIAHALEQRDRDFLLRPRSRYVGD